MIRRLPLVALLLAACTGARLASVAPPPGSLLPSAHAPPTAAVLQVDDYHGTSVADPFRWLEDDNSPQTEAWVAAENAVTESVLAGLQQRAGLRARLTELWNAPRVSGLRRVGGAYAWSRNDGLQPQDALVLGDTPAKDGSVVLDPSAWSKDGTVALADVTWSDDGRRAAYAVSEAGSDWRVLKVRDVASGKDTGDELRWVKFVPPAWAPDGSGFWYSRFPEPAAGQSLSAANHDMQVRFHRLGDSQSADRLVWADPAHPDWKYTLQVSDDGRWLVRTTWSGAPDRELIHVRPLGAPDDAPWTTIDDSWNLDIRWLGDDADVHYLLTRLDAPRGRVVAVDLAHPATSAWRELVPQRADTLQSADLFGDTLVLTYLRDAHSVVVLHSLRDGTDRELALPGTGSVTGFNGRRPDPETFFEYASFTEPPATFRLSLPDGRLDRVWRAPLRFDPDDFVTEQVRYPSRDGTQVPMFLVHRRDVRPDGNRPVFLYGYGGFDIPLVPAFRADMIPL